MTSPRSSSTDGAYRPIADYGMVGDMRSCALIGMNGSIDWMCIPHFDSPSVFARILDAERGGHFSIDPAGGDVACRQFYWPDTNVLITEMLCEGGSLEVRDFMPVGAAGGDPRRRRVVRRIACQRGAISVRVECRPAFDYARAEHAALAVPAGVLFEPEATGDDGPADLLLRASCPIAIENGAAIAELELTRGDVVAFIFGEIGGDEDDRDNLVEAEPCLDETDRLLDRALCFLRGRVGQCSYHGHWEEQVRRSALTLKLLTFEPTGAIVAAATTSLPECIGGGRNWDYRFTWVRDAAFTIYALMRIGFRDEAAAFLEFLFDRVDEEADEPLQVMYGLRGETELDESELEHLEGYRGSKPVRIGNAAANQLQLDIYGELLDAAYIFNKWGEPVSADRWRSLRMLVDWVCDNWQRPDEGVWEVRGPRRHFVFSKLMCWVAVDRGLRLAEKRSFPVPRERWIGVRDAIYREIFDRGWSDELQAFAMSYDEDLLDAANLIMPLVFFVAPNDGAMLQTIEAMRRPYEDGGLEADGLIYRYNSAEGVDGIADEEGTFNMCSFWLIESLTLAGRFRPDLLAEARLLFERMLTHANHLGLFAEQTSLRGEALGNVPQAFTHLSFISAAFNLNRAQNSGR